MPKLTSLTATQSQADQDIKSHRRSQLINWALGLVCIGWTGALVGCGSSSSTVLGDWKSRSELEGPARSNAVSFVIGNFGYLGTGLNSSNERLKDFWAYDQNKNTWVQLADMTGAARYNAVGFAIGTKGYVGTGVNANGDRLKDFWQYDQTSNTWKAVADFGGTARTGAVAFSIGTKGYVGTGFDGNYLKDFWAFDPTQNAWTKVASYSGAKREGGVAMVINGIGYVGTGNNNGLAQRDWYGYDPAQDLWVEKAQFTDDQYSSITRSYAVAFTINNIGYLTSGNSNGTVVWAYDPSKDTWSNSLGSFEGVSRLYAVGFAIGGKGYVATGTNGSSSKYDDLWEFDPTIAQDLNN